MKHLTSIFLSVLGFSFLSLNSYSQAGDSSDDESYCRANIAFQNPMVLGVTESGYAKCIKSQNYLDPGKPGKRVVINGDEFSDDGRNHDLADGDGILTSTQLFNYDKGEIPVPRGQYRLSNSNLILYDNEFKHSGKIEANRITVSCKFTWVKCSSWPREYQELCYRLCWPFKGNFEVTECSFGWRWL